MAVPRVVVDVVVGSLEVQIVLVEVLRTIFVEIREIDSSEFKK